jgi:hypothetical protein
MPLMLLLFSLLLPRVAIVLLWLLTNWFQGMFQNLFWPVLGFIFMPLTLLWYSAVVRFFNGQWTWLAMGGLVLAVFLDLSQSRWGHRRTAAVTD